MAFISRLVEVTANLKYILLLHTINAQGFLCIPLRYAMISVRHVAAVRIPYVRHKTSSGSPSLSSQALFETVKA